MRQNWVNQEKITLKLGRQTKRQQVKQEVQSNQDSITMHPIVLFIRKYDRNSKRKNTFIRYTIGPRTNL